MTMEPIQRLAEECIQNLSRRAKAFLGAEPAFDARLEYESEVDDFVTCHPSWVCSEADLTDLGREVRRQLQANPALISE